MLNAFRHHRKTHPAVAVIFTCERSCSTPFGIIGRLTHQGSIEYAALWGAQRLSASSEDSRNDQEFYDHFKLCSTPFGIIGRLTTSTPRSSCEVNRAQRLSASSEDSHGFGGDEAFTDVMCSTPFGIIGRLTTGRWCERYIDRACSTPFGIIGRLTRLSYSSSSRITGAQRLSASSEDSRLGLRLQTDGWLLCSTPFGIIGRLTKTLATSGLVGLACAQRLSASSEDSLTVGTPDRFTLDVLNAFRHHRKTHWRQEIADKAHIPVLNAFRHHRKTHDSRRAHNRCLDRVLNAFRHHRKTHLGQRGCVHSSSMCSTPFGIIGRLTVSSCRIFKNGSSAQRLSASSEDSRSGATPACFANSSAQRLSASSEDSRIVMQEGNWKAVSAQRLSASSEDSRKNTRHCEIE